MTTMTLTFHEDPGHGWLEAPRELIEKYRVSVSSYSYVSRDGSTFYLEEDCDAGKLISALKADGVKLTCTEKYHDYWPRNGGYINYQLIRPVECGELS